MLDPYMLSRTLSTSSSWSSLFEQDFLIRSYLEGGWLMRNTGHVGTTTIRPTDFGTIMFNIPVVDIDLERDRMLMNVISTMDNMNGVLNIAPDDDGEVILIYTVYLPDDIDFLDEYGWVIRSELRSIKEKIYQVRSVVENMPGSKAKGPEADGIFSADSFNRMMKDVLDSMDKKIDKEDTEEDDKE